MIMPESAFAKEIDENIPLRAIDCDNWRWIEEMSGCDQDGKSWRLVTLGGYLSFRRGRRHFPVEHGRKLGMTPDLDDPATLGCLLRLVREAWLDSKITTEYVVPDGIHPYWVVVDSDGKHIGSGPNEHHALVVALEGSNE